MNRRDHIALGLDIGGTEIKALALCFPDEILFHFELPSSAKEGPDQVKKAIAKAVERFQNEKIRFTTIGIGCAGSVDPKTGVVRNSPNFAKWSNVPLKAWSEEKFGVSVVAHNDANCAVFTEWKLGNAQGCKNAVLLTFGTGIGGGVILNGQLYSGSTGTAAELGHFSIHADGVQCPCGNRGCFERYCSATALQERAKGVSAKEIFERADEPFFREILSTFKRDLQVGVTSLANIFDPDCILLGGAVSEGFTPFLGEIEGWVRKHAFPSVGAHVRLTKTKYHNQSGAMGAALLALMNEGSTA